MITRIELTNFMSHEHTVLEPAAGLTVLVGPNNCGKSAVVGALEILAHNENSKYVVRHGAKECAVRVETDDGHVIEWRRKNNSPRYTIDGEQFDRLGRGGTPEQLQKTLRLGKVGTGERDTDVHFGDQKRPIFLLDSSELHAAQFFASSSDASHLVEMQTLHKQKTTAAQRDKVRLEAESARLNRELAALAPVAELDAQLRELEQAHAELCDLARCIAQHAADLSKRQAQELSRSRYEAQTQALARLPAPPVLASEQPLALLIQRLRQVERTQQQSRARAAALTPLTNPPEIAATGPLAQTIQAISQSAEKQRRARGTLSRLEPLVEPPVLHNLSELQRVQQRLNQCQQELRRRNRQHAALAELLPPQLTEPAVSMRTLEACLTQLKSATARAAACEDEHRARQEELASAAQRIKEWASQGQVCPACGSTLDPQHLVERITNLGAGP